MRIKIKNSTRTASPQFKLSKSASPHVCNFFRKFDLRTCGLTQQTCKIGPMLAISWQGWQNVGKFANALPMLPMFCQHLCKRRNYCRSSKFPRIFSRLCNDSGPFSFTYSIPICQKYFFFITIHPTLVEYWLNIGCQHRHYAFQPIQGQRWMPAPGQHWWIKFFLTTDNFL